MVPHAAFAGKTPDEMYFGRGDHVPGELAAGHARARAARLESNRQLSCGACRPPVRDPSGLPDPSANSRVLQVHDEMSGMCAAMLADDLAGESPAVVAFPGNDVAISAARKGDQLGESADGTALVGWSMDGVRALVRSARGASKRAGRSEGQGPPVNQEAPKRHSRPKRMAGQSRAPSLTNRGEGRGRRRRENWEQAADGLSGDVEDGMSGQTEQRKHGTTRGSPRRSRTAKASRITGPVGKSRRACEWGGWGRISDDGPGQKNPDRSEGPWGRAAQAARMVVRCRATDLTLSRILRYGCWAHEGRMQTNLREGCAGSRPDRRASGEGGA